MILSAVRAARKGPIPRGYAPREHVLPWFLYYAFSGPCFHKSPKTLCGVEAELGTPREQNAGTGPKTGSGTGAERQKTAGRGAPPSGGFQHELSVTESISWTRCPPTSRPFWPFRWPPTSPRNRRSLRRSQSPRHHRPSSPNASEQPPRGRAQHPRRPSPPRDDRPPQSPRHPVAPAAGPSTREYERPRASPRYRCAGTSR